MSHSHSHTHNDNCHHSSNTLANELNSSSSSVSVNNQENNGILSSYILPPSLTVEYTLRQEFLRAEQLYHHIEGDALLISSSSPTSSTSSSSVLTSMLAPCTNHSLTIHVQDALAAFLHCSDMVRREGIFSKDEIIEDINTEDIRYLLIEYYIALLRMKQETTTNNPKQRLSNINQAKIGLELFIEQLFHYGIIHQQERNTTFQNILQADDDTSSVAQSNHQQDRSTTTKTNMNQQQLMRNISMGNDLRTAKIERFKRNQVAKKRLQELNANAIHQYQIKKLFLQKINYQTEEDIIPDGVTSNNGYSGEPDEEIVREIALLELNIAARTAVDEILSINQELPLLHHALQLLSSNNNDDYNIQQKQYEQEQQYKHKHKYENNTFNGIPANDISIRPDRPGIQVTHIDPTYTIVKETIKADIFKSGHRPPTMSMEEWGDIVMERTKERQDREAIQTQNRVATLEEIIEQGKEDDEALYDAAMYRKRGFEDWADGVPKGSGNTKRI